MSPRAKRRPVVRSRLRRLRALQELRAFRGGAPGPQARQQAAASVKRKRRLANSTAEPAKVPKEEAVETEDQRVKRAVKAARKAGVSPAIIEQTIEQLEDTQKEIEQLEAEIVAKRAQYEHAVRMAEKQQQKKQQKQQQEQIEKKPELIDVLSASTSGGPCLDKASGSQPQELPPVAKTAKQLQVKGDSASGSTLRQKMQICIEEDPYGDCPDPISSFGELESLPSFVAKSLQSHGILAPLPIQAQALPLVLAGRDVIGLAQTGSGKTLAFLIPVAVKIADGDSIRPASANEPVALVLAPTRELAVQIAQEADKMFECAKGAKVSCVYGGGDKYKQQKQLSWGVHILVATPGRLLDFIETSHVRMGSVSYFVLDEADRMLDMGFHEDVVAIAGKAKKKRQTLFFSATWNAEVQALAKSFCRANSQPVRISYAQKQVGEAKHAAREGIVQEVVVIDTPGGRNGWEAQEAQKNILLDKHLRKVLKASPEHKILVFVSQKNLADKVSARLQAEGFKADSMHGGKSQDCRLWVLDQFRKSELRVLVATDVIGRGIDIPSVSHVVVHEMGETEDYVHRIGRTARGQYGKGHALVFFEYWEGYPQIAEELIGILEASKQTVPEALRTIAAEVAAGKRAVRKPAWKQ